MKNFRAYLIESERTYKYRIKFVGEVPADFVKSLKDKLAQFDPVKIADTKETPVMARSVDFPSHPNEKLTMMDVEFRYPAVEPQIKDLAQILGLDPNRIRMEVTEYSEKLYKELGRIDTENKDLLTDTDFTPNTAESEEAKKEYAQGPYDHAALRNAYRSDFTVAGGTTPKAKTTNDLPQGDKSPMTNIKRPPKPATGAEPRG